MKKEIIFVTGALSGGGAERVISILANGCAELGHSVEVVVLRNKQTVYPISEKVKVVQLPSYEHFTTIRRIWKLHSILKASSAQTIIPFLQIITIYTLLANIGLGKNIVTSVRADPNMTLVNSSLKDRTANFLMRKIGFIHLTNWVVFQTPEAQICYPKSIQQKSSIIPNPLDTSRLPERFEGEREKRIIAAGRFSEEKNFPMLLRAFAAFHKEFPAYRLELCGEGALRGEYEAMLAQLGVADAVEMPGFVSNLAGRMRTAAMFISTSNHEGISNSMLEALGMGVPTIVTDCPVGGARMFVKNGENGVLIPMEDEQALLDGMRRIASDPGFAEAISRNAVKIREELAAEKICQQWLGVVERITQ